MSNTIPFPFMRQVVAVSLRPLESVERKIREEPDAAQKLAALLRAKYLECIGEVRCTQQLFARPDTSSSLLVSLATVSPSTATRFTS